MTTIKDSVHDHIEVDGVAADLLDTPAMQRLRRISQLGTVKFVYPSANHTRFEHSLGVYHLACQALSHLRIDGERAERIRAAALLHDVGHGPYSHNIEDVTERRTGKFHDDVHELLETGDVGDVLREHGHSPERIADLIAGEGRYGQLVSGELDVDRMDYLVRDAHHTGAPYGTIDHERLVRELTFDGEELVLQEGNVQTAESLLVARALMTPVVYNHPVSRIAKSILRRAAERLLADGLDGETLRRMDDYDFRVAMRQNRETAEWARRLDERDLFKRAVWAELDDVPVTIVDADHETVRECEVSIANRADVDESDVLLDVPARPAIAESTSRVLVNGEVRRLEEHSPLVEALRSASRAQWRLGVYAPAADTDRVGQAAASVLGLDSDALISERRHGVNATLDEFDHGGTDE